MSPTNFSISAVTTYLRDYMCSYVITFPPGAGTGDILQLDLNIMENAFTYVTTVPANSNN